MPRRRQRFQPLHEVAEIGDHLRCAAGEVDRWDVGLRQPINHAVDRLARHDFLSLRPGIHMAMHAGQVTKLAHIDLQDLRLRVSQRQRMLGQPLGETVHAR